MTLPEPSQSLQCVAFSTCCKDCAGSAGTATEHRLVQEVHNVTDTASAATHTASSSLSHFTCKMPCPVHQFSAADTTPTQSKLYVLTATATATATAGNSPGHVYILYISLTPVSDMTGCISHMWQPLFTMTGT